VTKKGLITQFFSCCQVPNFNSNENDVDVAPDEDSDDDDDEHVEDDREREPLKGKTDEKEIENETQKWINLLGKRPRKLGHSPSRSVPPTSRQLCANDDN
jgi:hypothetical protein